MGWDDYGLWRVWALTSMGWNKYGLGRVWAGTSMGWDDYGLGRVWAGLDVDYNFLESFVDFKENENCLCFRTFCSTHLLIVSRSSFCTQTFLVTTTSTCKSYNVHVYICGQEMLSHIYVNSDVMYLESHCLNGLNL